MLGSHGLFTWGDTAYKSYINTLEVIERCAEYVEDNYRKKEAGIWWIKKFTSLAKEERIKKAAVLMPILRGLCLNSDLTKNSPEGREQLLIFLMMKKCLNLSTQMILINLRQWVQVALIIFFAQKFLPLF